VCVHVRVWLSVLVWRPRSTVTVGVGCCDVRVCVWGVGGGGVGGLTLCAVCTRVCMCVLVESSDGR
jgi:hypothetical protein